MPAVMQAVQRRRWPSAVCPGCLPCLAGLGGLAWQWRHAGASFPHLPPCALTLSYCVPTCHPAFPRPPFPRL